VFTADFIGISLLFDFIDFLYNVSVKHRST